MDYESGSCIVNLNIKLLAIPLLKAEGDVVLKECRLTQSVHSMSTLSEQPDVVSPPVRIFQRSHSLGLQSLQAGFTLIELMIVVVIIAVLAAIAFPSYQQYVERKDLALAKQEALKIAAELERFKSKNFSYKGFDASYLYSYQATDGDGNTSSASHYDKTTGKLSVPVGAAEVKYILTLVDGGAGYKPLTITTDNSGAETEASSKIQGLSWSISVERVKNGAEPKQPRNFDLLLKSDGIRCMTKVKDIVIGYENCGGYSETW